MQEDLLAGELEIKLFIKFERTENLTSSHEVKFLEVKDFPWNDLLTAFSENSLSFKEIEKDYFTGYAMVIRLSGLYGSLDEFRLKQISADQKTGIKLQLESVKVESQDGVPFNVVPLFVIPLNESLKKYPIITLEFHPKSRNFLTGKVTRDLSRVISPFEFYFGN